MSARWAGRRRSHARVRARARRACSPRAAPARMQPATRQKPRHPDIRLLDACAPPCQQPRFARARPLRASGADLSRRPPLPAVAQPGSRWRRPSPRPTIRDQRIRSRITPTHAPPRRPCLLPALPARYSIPRRPPTPTRPPQSRRRLPSAPLHSDAHGSNALLGSPSTVRPPASCSASIVVSGHSCEWCKQEGRQAR